MEPDRDDDVRCWRRPGLLGGMTILRADFRRRRFPRHFHEEYTVGVVTRGVNRFAYRRDRVAAPAGTICMADPGEVHTGEADEDGWSYWTAYVTRDALARLRTELDEAASQPPDFVSGVVDDSSAVARMAGFFRSLGSACALEQETRALEAMAYLIRRYSAAPPPPASTASDAPVASAVRDRLAEDLDGPVTLTDLEQATGVGRFRLLRAFARAYGLPPHAWRLQLRLGRAHAAIASGAPIALAAAEAGFADQAHLTRLFKRTFGYTPGALARGQ